MHEQTPRNLPWLERLAIHIPGYGGYLDRGNRRAADRALRDAVAQRLGTARSKIEGAIRSLMNREALGPASELQRLSEEGVHAMTEATALEKQRHQIMTEINTLERLERHLDHVTQRIKSAGAGTDAFYASHNLDAAKADTLHAFDLALFERAEALLQRFDSPDLDHNLLANLEAELNEFEQKLDERASLLQGIR